MIGRILLVNSLNFAFIRKEKDNEYSYGLCSKVLFITIVNGILFCFLLNICKTHFNYRLFVTKRMIIIIFRVS